MRLKPIAANVTEIHINNTIFFFSYETLVGVTTFEESYRTNQFYSVTTSRHLNRYGYRYAKEVSPEELEELFKEACKTL